MSRRFMIMTVFVMLLGVSGFAPAALSPTPLERATLHGDELIETPVGPIKLQDTYFDDTDAQKLFDEMDYERANQVYIWAMPIVSMVTWRDAQKAAFGVTKDTDFAVVKTLNEKRGIVTANLTTPYILNFISLAKGPIQIDYPAGKTAGGVLDFWQRPVCDLGLTGPDQGNASTYIIVGPLDDPAKYQKNGVHVFQSETNNIMIGLRILNTDPGFYDVFIQNYKMGRVGGEIAPCRFIKGVNAVWNATAPRGIGYWKKLAMVINEEPVREIDKSWMAMIEPLGIVKGHEFKPDERQTKILKKSAAMGELMNRNLQVNPRYTTPWWEGTHWYKSFDFQISQENGTIQQIDQRGTWFYEAVTSTKGMVHPTPGAGQVYMTTKRDNNGDLLRTDKTYVLHVPANVPVGQFWALTLYSEDTRRPYDNGGTEVKDVNLDSRMKQLQYNKDGSIDLYIGVKAPKGMESNFMKTVGDDGWFVYFRLYAPKEAFFDKTFVLPDFEMVK